MIFREKWDKENAVLKVQGSKRKSGNSKEAINKIETAAQLNTTTGCMWVVG